MAKVRWDIDMLNSSMQTLRGERNNLQNQRGQMQQQRNRVDTAWKSPAGQQYQNRLANDVAAIDHIIGQLDRRLTSLQGTASRYKTCEDKIATALRRLP